MPLPLIRRRTLCEEGRASSMLYHSYMNKQKSISLKSFGNLDRIKIVSGQKYGQPNIPFIVLSSDLEKIISALDGCCVVVYCPSRNNESCMVGE